MKQALKQINLYFEVRWPVAVVFFILFFKSVFISPSDLGHRFSDINVDLYHRFAPAMAYQILEDIDKEQVVMDLSILPLVSGFPQLPPLHLDEVHIIFEAPVPLDKRPITSALTSTQTKPENLQLEEPLFTTFEKKRIQIAKQQFGVDFDRTDEIEELSFKEKMREVVTKIQSESQADVISSNKNSAPDHRIQIAGEIEFTRDGSLALTDQHYIDIRRFEEGVPKETGSVNLATATFEINVPNDNGLLVARLTNHNGTVEGEAIVSLKELRSRSHPKIVLRKKSDRGKVTSRSAYSGRSGGSNREPATYKKTNRTSESTPKRESESQAESNVSLFGRRILDPEAPEVNSKDGERIKEFIDLDRLEPSSQVVAEGTQFEHATTLSVLDLQKSHQLLLFPQRMLLGIRQILEEQGLSLDLSQGDSLIWGKVNFKGRPYEGATVTLANHRTSYMGGFFLPDQTRSVTANNGIFLVSTHLSGWVDLEIEVPTGESFYESVFIQAGKISQVEIETYRPSIPIVVRSYDAFSGEPVPSRVDFQNTKQTLIIGGRGFENTSISQNQNPQTLTTAPTFGYEPITFMPDSNRDYIHLPQIPQQWLNSFLNVPFIKGKKPPLIAVGFVQGESFRVQLEPTNGQPHSILYFNSKGEHVVYGVPGGGFVILGLENETKNAYIISEKSHRVFSRILNPSLDRVQVLITSFE